MDGPQLTARGIYSDEPPPFQSRSDLNPTLLVSWWCTIFALTTILIRISGRWVRTEKLFREDKIMFYSIIPLLIRMGLVHVVLIWGTNNATTELLTRQEILHRETGSKIVLAARIFYAAFIWVAKLTVLEFLKRTIGASWARSYEIGLRLIYGFLLVTFVAVVIGTLSECQPFDHYYQVVPDPGPRCRQGLVQLITMGVCDIVTDLVLIIFPIPVVVRSSMPVRKRFSLIALFLLSTILVAITAYRIPSTISRKSSQQFRSLLASLEILAAAGVSNAVIIGSFIRDKGVKKAKFRAPSVEGNNVLARTPTRNKSVTLNHWGSDEDLVRDMGVALPRDLRHGSLQDKKPRAAPVAPPGEVDSPPRGQSSNFDSKWDFTRGEHHRRGSDSSVSSGSTDIKLRDLRNQYEDPISPGAAPEPLSKQMSFFDVGGLVDKPTSGSPAGTSREVSLKDQPIARGRSSSKAFLSDIGGLLTRHREEEELSTTTGGNLTPSKTEKRKYSRSPRPLKVADETRSKPAAGGPDSLKLSDAGGLLG